MSASMQFSLNFSGAEVFQQSHAARARLNELDAHAHAERTRLFAILTAANLFSDPEVAATAAAGAAQSADLAGDEVSRAWALVAASIVDLSCAATPRRLEMTRDVLRIAIDTGETEFLPISFFLHLAALAELGDIAALDLTLSPVGPVLGHFPELNDGRHATWFRCLQSILSGDVRTAEQLARQGLAVSQPDDPDAHAVYLGQLGIIRWVQGRVVELEPLFLQARQAAPHEPVWAVSLAWMSLKQGRLSAARTLVTALPPVAELPVDRNWLSTVCILTEVVSQLREVELARELYAALLPYADRLVTIGLGIACWGTVARPLALAALTLGDTELAISHYRHGIEVTSRCGAHPWLAEMQWELARLLGDAADGSYHHEAAELATESLATAQALHLHMTEEYASRTLASLRSTLALRQTSGPADPVHGVSAARIQVFSGFAVTSVDGSEARWQSRKARQMLKILVARRGTAMSRETLMDMLWPDVPSHRLANRFSVAIAAVRRALDPAAALNRDAFLEYRDGLIRLRIEAVSVDAEEFLTAAQQAIAEPATPSERIARLTGALARFTGEPLQEEQHELWSADFRREIHEAFFTAAHALAELFADEGDHLSRLETYRRVLALDEFDQRAHEGVIASLAALGAHGRADAARDDYIRTVGSLGVTLDEPATHAHE